MGLSEGVERGKCGMEYIRSKHSGLYTTHFPIHRGDYFQGVLSRPEDPLRVAIIIRAMNKVPCTSWF